MPGAANMLYRRTVTTAKVEGMRTTVAPRSPALAVIHVTAPLAVIVVLAGVALEMGPHVPVLGAPVIGVLLGFMASRVVGHRSGWNRTISFLAQRSLQFGVVLLGASLSLTQVVHTGFASLPVMLGTLGACLLAATFVGRALGIPRVLRVLIGAGTGICGASAIAAVAPTIKAKAPDIAYAISTIFAFNVAAVLTFPLLGHVLGLSQHSFGLFAGTAVNDTSSVIAAASVYGAAAAQYAVVVKLTRSLMIIPVTIYLGARSTWEAQRRPGYLHYVRLVPWFLIGFLTLAALHTAGAVPATAKPELQWTTTALITSALTAIGMQTDVVALRRTGHRPLILGGILWVTVACTSLLLQSL